MNRIALSSLLLPLLVAVACAGPQRAKEPEGPVYTLSEIPLSELRADVEKYRGALFEDRFKYYWTYRSKEDVDFSRSKQTILGKTHFTARPIDQYTHAVQIQITPDQDRKLVEMGVRRQDVLKCRVRFAGIAPGGATAFDLVEILD